LRLAEREAKKRTKATGIEHEKNKTCLVLGFGRNTL
jgi:hypothetical protein